jgi:uncharacterized protein YcfL
MVFKKLLNSLIFTGFSFLIIGCSATNEQLNEDLVNQKKIYEKEQITPILINEINQIILAIKQNNLALLNGKYIHPINGYYDVTKFQNKNIFEIKKSISEVDNNIDFFEIKTEKATFNCSPLDDSLYGWDKEGVFLNPQTTPYITKIMEEANLKQANSYKIEEIEKADFIEQTSYEVIISYNMIFYITKLENNWYITLIDNTTTDCSR